MSELANYFVKKPNVQVHLILYGKNRDVFFPVEDDIKIYRPEFHFSAHSRFISTLKTLRFLRKTVQRIKPDTILSFGEYWNNFVLLALWGLNVPVYISDRCQPDKSLGTFHNGLRKWLYPNATGIIAQTSKAKQIYMRQGLNTNIQVIGNPIYEVETNGAPHKRENMVLTVGRLIESKHHDRLIKMFKAICTPGWKLVIAGGDALKQAGMKRLRTLVDEQEMSECIELTGTVSDIDSYYRRSRIFAFTSSSEGFPNVIGEAMSAGLPIIAYDCVAGPSDLIEDEENGFLIPLFNDEMYAEKLKDLMNDENLQSRMGETSKELVKKFSLENTAEDYFLFIRGKL
jgi:GalNAc-alpha-(1->4)-GalNAc-alpha-(1->3)-diNAcBac-PP-undecaprenol alpha-1,4-N-acetyl-D-galactosaminyltransferase